MEEQFKAHLTRHASTSNALIKGLDFNSIRNAAGWSKDSKVFVRFYNRTVKETENNFAQMGLSSK